MLLENNLTPEIKIARNDKTYKLYYKGKMYRCLGLAGRKNSNMALFKEFFSKYMDINLRNADLVITPYAADGKMGYQVTARKGNPNFYYPALGSYTLYSIATSKSEIILAKNYGEYRSISATELIYFFIDGNLAIGTKSNPVVNRFIPWDSKNMVKGDRLINSDRSGKGTFIPPQTAWYCVELRGAGQNTRSSGSRDFYSNGAYSAIAAFLYAGKSYSYYLVPEGPRRWNYYDSRTGVHPSPDQLSYFCDENNNKVINASSYGHGSNQEGNAHNASMAIYNMTKG